MAEVFRGVDVRLGRDVAVKVLRADLARNPSFQTRFRREAQAAASLNAPSIVSVFDTGEDDAGVPYIVMELLHGRTLRDVLLSEGRLLPERACEVVPTSAPPWRCRTPRASCTATSSPPNVMLTRDGDVKVMDFGIARAAADAASSMTQASTVLGTAAYLSPEQARGDQVDARSDLYSTGCVLYELLTGAPPFTGDSAVAVVYQHVREEPPAPSVLDAGCHPPWTPSSSRR
jgi:serine/threonine-protein kinase